MQREIAWKASQIVFIVRWAYFTPSASKPFALASKDIFFRAIDNPCKKLEDLSSLLSLVVDEIGGLISSSELSDQVFLSPFFSKEIKC